MDFSDYYRQRTFQEPFFKVTEVVGIQAVVWAFLFGPFFFWKKRARAEALLLALAMAPILDIGYSGSRYSVTLSGLAYLTPLVWIGFAAFAPLLLNMAFRRKRWVEIGGAQRGPN
jgi:hypothetical protein